MLTHTLVTLCLSQQNSVPVQAHSAPVPSDCRYDSIQTRGLHLSPSPTHSRSRENSEATNSPLHRQHNLPIKPNARHLDLTG
jgi:hypothetical protein